MNKKIALYRSVSCAIVAAGYVAVSSPLHAAELSAQFRTGYSTSDNIARTSANEIDEEMVFVGTTLVLTEQTPRLNANLRVSADYFEFLSDTFEAQVVGGFAGDLGYAVIPERLTWTIRDSYGQRLLNPLAQPSPGNREDVNNFATGLSLRVPVGNRFFYDLSSQFRAISFEESSIFDNQRLNGQIQFGKQIGSDTTVSLNVAKEATGFDNGGFSSDFDVTSTFVRYDVRSTRNDMTIDVGHTKLESDNGQGGSGFLLRMDWARTISPRTRLVTGMGSRYSDQGDIFGFSLNIANDVGDTVDTDGGDSPFRNNYVFASYIISSQRTRINLNAQWSEDDYEVPNNPERELAAAEISVSRDLSARFYTDFRVRGSKREYKNINQVDDQLDITATLGLRLSTAFDVSISFLRIDRESNIALQEFTENRGVIQLNYTPAWGRTSRATIN